MPKRWLVFWGLVASLAGSVAASGQAPVAGDGTAPHRVVLLDGVNQLPVPGIPGPLAVLTTNAFPVVAAPLGRTVQGPVVAAALWGPGRVVVLGHDGYFGQETLAHPGAGQLMLNAARWSSGQESPRIGVLRERAVVEFLQKHNLPVTLIAGDFTLSSLAEYDVLILNAGRLTGEPQVEALRAFVERGGGLIAASLGWGWLQLNPGKTLRDDHPGNRLLGAAGLAWLDGQFETRTGFFATVPELPVLLSAPAALTALQQNEAAARVLSESELAQAAATLQGVAAIVPANNQTLRPALATFAGGGLTLVPTSRQPLKLPGQAIERLKLALAVNQLNIAPPAATAPHPAADDFPGVVPATAPRVTRTVPVDTRITQWHSTGLYAAPGEVLTVTLPAAATGRGLRLRIGCHTDNLSGSDSWSRVPEITRAFELRAVETQAANAFGGLVYVEVPRAQNLGEIALIIGSAVPAPHFKLGETDLVEWREAIRHHPAPWAELEGRYLTISLPSENVRQLDDPDEVCRFWDRVQEANARLAALPQPRRDRFVLDRQISAGYMHSGYPIMAHLDQRDRVADWESLRQGNWGFFHELGHNHQSRDWTFAGTVEVTCNWFSMHAFEKVCELPRTGHDALQPASRERRMRQFFNQASTFEDWQRDPFLALLVYLQLIEEFGWESYYRVLAGYQALPAAERPQTDPDRRDQFVVRFSMAVGRNLGPLFAAWKIPVSAAARERIAHLPEWMPPDFPPAAPET